MYFCNNDVTFLFKDVQFKQLNGVLIGSPLSSIVVEIYQNELEKKVIFNNTPLKNLFYYGYVDDIFMVILDNSVKNESKLSLIL